MIPAISPSLFSKLLAATFFFCLALCLAIAPARAQPFDYGSVRLLQTGASSGALFFELNSPWKISWRKNTVNVFPTEIRWRSNASSFLWPFPQSFDLFGVQSYGYEGLAALPFTTRAAFDVGEQVEVRFAVCAQVCLPVETSLTTETASEQERRIIAAAREQVPQKTRQETKRESAQESGQAEAQEQKIQLAYLPLGARAQEGAQEGQSVLLQGSIPIGQESLQNPRLIVEQTTSKQGGLFKVISLEESRDQESPNQESRDIRFEAEGTLPQKGQQSPLRLTLVADNLLPVVLQATPELAPSPYAFADASTTSPPVSASLLGLLSLAFLAGLVLNAMPCVFPVLAVKISSLARADSADHATSRSDKTTRPSSGRLQRALFANALGMMLAFLILACVLVLAKSSGEKLGWGFQFHWPVFSGTLAALLLLLACDGWRVAPLPFPAYHEQAKHNRPKNITRRQEWSSECTTGLLLTWLATPCAAPVLGSALSVAIVQQTPVLFLMFAFMGAGMAAPLLLAALFPRQVARILPRPGAWAEVLRKTLATAIFVASLWLFSIFAKQLSLLAACILAATTLLVVLALRKREQARLLRSVPRHEQPSHLQTSRHRVSLHRFFRHRFFRHRFFAPARLALLLTSPVLIALVLNWLVREGVLPSPLSTFASSTTSSSSSSSSFSSSWSWQTFAPERIPALLANERLVVVNVTADWCLSCKVIDQRVYKTAAVRARLERSPHVVLMRADWTSHDARIADFMRQHQRYAIPFTALFAPAGEVLLLPELYGQQTFLDALAYAETLRAQKSASQP